MLKYIIDFKEDHQDVFTIVTFFGNCHWINYIDQKNMVTKLKDEAVSLVQEGEEKGMVRGETGWDTIDDFTDCRRTEQPLPQEAPGLTSSPAGA